MASKSKVSKVASKTGRRSAGKVASGPGKVKSKKKTLPAARERERKTSPRRRPQPKVPEIPPVAAVPVPAAAPTEHGAVPHSLDQHVSEPGGGAGENAPSMQPPPEEPAPVQDPSPVSGA